MTLTDPIKTEEIAVLAYGTGATKELIQMITDNCNLIKPVADECRVTRFELMRMVLFFELHDIREFVN